MTTFSEKGIHKPLFLSIYVIFCFIILVVLYSIQYEEFSSWLRYFSIVVVVQLTFQYLLLKWSCNNIFNLTGIFLILAYLFHFGQIVLVGSFPEYQFNRFNFVYYLNPIILKKTAIFCLISLQFVFLGILITIKRSRVKSDETSNYNNILNICKYMGFALVLMFFPIQIYLDTIILLTSIKNGYIATYSIGISGMLYTFGFFSFIGYALLIMGYSRQKKRSILLFVFITMYLIISMFSGHRGHQITIIIFYFYLIHRLVYKINFKRLAVLCVVLFFALTSLNTVAEYRGNENKSIASFGEIFVKKIKQNPVMEFVSEIGGTIYTPYLTIEQIPLNRPYGYGITYPLGFVSVFPNIGGYFDEINKKALFTKNLQGSALGGSFIGELYYNFSYAGAFFAMLVGMFVNFISNKVEYHLSTGNYYKLAYYASIFIYTLWWTRDAFQSILRPFFWGIFVLLIIGAIAREIESRKRKNQLIIKYN